MTLFWWELKKIWCRRMTRLLLGLCLAFAAVEPLTLGFANLGFGADVAAPTWEARARIVQATADAGAWQGPLTPAVLQAAREDCRAVVKSQGRVDGQAAFVQGNILYTAAEVFTDNGCISWENWPAKMTALEDGTLDRFYDLWQDTARRQIEAAPDDQQALLAALRDRVALPFTYDWVAGHTAALSALSNVIYLVGLLLCVGVVPLFCSELRTGVFPVSHCARRGRGKLTAAKLAAALAFAGGGFALCMAVFMGVQLAMFGSRGLSASLQIADCRSLFPLTLGQTEALLLAAGLLSCMAGAALAAALSAAFAGEFPALAALVGGAGAAAGAVRPGARRLVAGLSGLGRAFPDHAGGFHRQRPGHPARRGRAARSALPPGRPAPLAGGAAAPGRPRLSPPPDVMKD